MAKAHKINTTLTEIKIKNYKFYKINYMNKNDKSEEKFFIC